MTNLKETDQKFVHPHKSGAKAIGNATYLTHLKCLCNAWVFFQVWFKVIATAEADYMTTY